MDVVKLKPATKDNLWGGTKLKTKFKKECDSEILAECWELSFNENGPCFIDSGVDKGKLLKDVATKKDLGKIPSKFKFFPVLIKFIDSDQNLSVQVHPSDDYALEHENSFGKTEIWYVLGAEKGAGLYVGLNKDYTQEEIENALKNNSILDCLNFYECKPGEFFSIEAGTIHAIGKGITVIEIQQNSDLTYRLYDYNRVDKNGKTRELHIDKALNVINLKKYNKVSQEGNLLYKSKYFSSYKYDVKDLNIIEADESSFVSFSIINGSGYVNEMEANLGDTFFVPAKKKCRLSGEFDYVLTKLEK